MIIEIELGYTSPRYANDHRIVSTNPHRVGKAIKIKCLCPKKRHKLITHLVMKGATSFAVSEKWIYFDTDDLVKPTFRVIC